MKRFLFNMSDINYKSLKKLSKNTKTPIGTILNKMINEFLANNELKEEKLQYYLQNKLENFKRVEVNLTDKECQIIKRISEKNMHNSIKKELRYIIVNSIYDYKFNSEIELKTFILAKNALNAIGRNLNQFMRELKKRNLITINNKEIEKNISNISNKIDFLSQKLDRLIDNTERIFK